MTAECPECDQFVGRRREICTGAAELPWNTINTYRQRWGLPPLPPRTANPVREPQTSRKLSGGRKANSKGGGCISCGSTIVERAKKLATATIDFWKDGMTIANAEQQEKRQQICNTCPLNLGKTCADCGCFISMKIKARSSFCPQARWFSYADYYQPVVNPTRYLIFHVYPKLGAEWNWKWHLANIRRVAEKFDRIVIAIATGAGLAPPRSVQACLQGINVEWILHENDKTAETGSLPKLLRAVKTDDPNTITFRAHCKGVTHARDSVEQRWARLMWQACMELSSVDDALASHLMAGAMKCHEPLVTEQKYRWFYAGTFFWFRNKEIFQRDWETMEDTRWYVEAWPGVICRNEEAASLCHDFTAGSTLRPAYWKKVVIPSWDKWKAAHPQRITDWD